jgi:hypothetical protein
MGCPVPDRLFIKAADRDDFLVIRDDQMVGTIHKVYRAIPEPWRWRVDSRFGNDIAGWSASYEDAKRDFRKAWDAKA